jgi:hypothetical protein
LPGHQRGAIPFRGVAEEDARAGGFTITRFKIRSIDFPFFRHRASPFDSGYKGKGKLHIQAILLAKNPVSKGRNRVFG